MKQNVSEHLSSKMSQLNIGTEVAEDDWVVFRDVVYNSTLIRLGQNTRRHQDWFNENDEEIWKMLGEKYEAYRILQQNSKNDDGVAIFKRC